MKLLWDDEKGPGVSWAYVSLDFLRVVWPRQINLGLDSLCIKFKELEIELLVREKGQSERPQLRPEPRATYAEKRGRGEHQKLRSSRQCLGKKPGNPSRRLN